MVIGQSSQDGGQVPILCENITRQQLNFINSTDAQQTSLECWGFYRENGKFRNYLKSGRLAN